MVKKAQNQNQTVRKPLTQEPSLGKAPLPDFIHRPVRQHQLTNCQLILNHRNYVNHGLTTI